MKLFKEIILLCISSQASAGYFKCQKLKKKFNSYNESFIYQINKDDLNNAETDLL